MVCSNTSEQEVGDTSKNCTFCVDITRSAVCSITHSDRWDEE
jgi:hypothetical protein